MRMGRFVVCAVMIVATALAVVAAVVRARRGPSLPLAPCAVLLITTEGALDLGPWSSDAVRYANAHGVTSDALATLGALVTGRMPRANGLVRRSDSLATDVATLAEQMQPFGFAGAAFVRSTEPFAGHGLLRGCATMRANEATSSCDAAAQLAGDWLLARKRAPSFCWLHLGRLETDGGATDSSAACAKLCARLDAADMSRAIVVVAIGLERAEAPELLLHLPAPLLPTTRDERDVSLLDVAPTLLELFGIPVPSELTEPFLLDPVSRGPRCFLFADPLPAPLLDADVVTLRIEQLVYRLDPTQREPRDVEVLPDERARPELRRILESAFGYRIEDVARGETRIPVARYVGRAARR